MTTIFLDEAGWTGDHLMNGEQPAFVLASHQIPEAECAALLGEAFPRNQAPELKHTNVRKRPASQRAMATLVTRLRSEQRRIALYPTHKQFALFQRLFDYMVEPVLFERGFNAYAGGFNIQATNTAYVGLTTVLGEPFMRRLLTLFETAVRERSPVHLTQMWAHLERARSSRPGGHRRMIDLLLLGKRGSRARLNNIPDNGLDVALSAMVALVAHWRGLSAGPFDVIHDQSSSLAKHTAVWEWLSSPEQQEVTLGFGDYRDALLPLNVTSTAFGASHDHAGLQLADLLAGGQMEICRYLLGNRSNEAYAQALMAAGLDEAVNNIWPDINWRMPDKRGDKHAVDPLEFMLAAPWSEGPQRGAGKPA